MNIYKFIHDLQKRGFSLSVQAGKLLVSPGSSLTALDRRDITAMKDAMIAELTRPAWGPSPQPQQRPWPLGSAGVMLGMPPWHWCDCGRTWTIGQYFPFCPRCGAVNEA